jgi:hypothetical protein
LVEYCNKQSSSQHSKTILWNEIWVFHISADKD